MRYELELTETKIYTHKIVIELPEDKDINEVIESIDGNSCFVESIKEELEEFGAEIVEENIDEDGSEPDYIEVSLKE